MAICNSDGFAGGGVASCWGDSSDARSSGDTGDNVAQLWHGFSAIANAVNGTRQSFGMPHIVHQRTSAGIETGIRRVRGSSHAYNLRRSSVDQFPNYLYGDREVWWCLGHRCRRTPVDLNTLFIPLPRSLAALHSLEDASRLPKPPLLKSLLGISKRVLKPLLRTSAAHHSDPLKGA